MGWKFGIPDALGPYTYFNTLNTNLLDDASKAKKHLYDLASNELSSGLSQLTNIEKIKAATDFIKLVADSERGKELAAIQAYCKETSTNFPALEEYLKDPQSIYNNPDKFYSQLTAAISKIRMGTKEYLRELKKIKSNIDSIDKNGKNTRTFYNYLFDDYRYKLVADITSFMAHLTHNDNWIKSQLKDFQTTEFNTKIEAIAMRILDSMHIEKKISSAEDFAAIAASVLIDLEKQIQIEIDESEGKESMTINNVSDALLNRVEQQYMKQLQQRPDTPVQKALNNINGIDFTRITTNAKELLGIEIPDNLKNDQNLIEKVLRKKDKQQNLSTKNLRNKIRNNQLSLSDKLKLINFSISGSFFTKQGSINELILSMFGSNVRKNVATDVITYILKWNTQINTSELDSLVRNLGEEFGSVLGSEESHGSSNSTDIRPAITRMQNNVDKLIAEAEKQLSNSKQLDKEHDLFVFHETLKLYSTVETGRGTHAGFGGRNMNILSYIDYLSSASSVGVKNNIDRDILAFFARNLIKGAIAEKEKAPLEHYFSIYAGMIMFDDVIAMAKEAVSQINNSNNVIGGKIRQVHLYNLNGLYVPASMILTYLSDSLNKNNQKIIEDMMRVEIHTSAIDTAPAKGKSSKFAEKQKKTAKTYNTFINNLKNDSNNLTPSDWDAISAAAVNSTKVQIIFLASFEQFINNLFGLQ